ncbi:hypothetical protein J5751_02420 [bacterium]|nr:hypothetical protein [bacterium]
MRQFVYSFGFNVQHFWHTELLDKQESLQDVLSRLYQIGLIARYNGIHIIGVSSVTNNTDIMWKNELSDLADMSLAVRIIAIIQKNTKMHTIIIATFFEFSVSHPLWNIEINCSKFI